MWNNNKLKCFDQLLEQVGGGGGGDMYYSIQYSTCTCTLHARPPSLCHVASIALIHEYYSTCIHCSCTKLTVQHYFTHFVHITIINLKLKIGDSPEVKYICCKWTIDTYASLPVLPYTVSLLLISFILVFNFFAHCQR